MAVLAATLNRRYKSSREAYVHTQKEPLSFHLTFLLGGDFELPEGKTPVDVLRMPFNSSVDTVEGAGSSPSVKCFGIDRQMFSGISTNPTGTKMQLWTKKFNTSNSKCNEFEGMARQTTHRNGEKNFHCHKDA
jgi:hypothetical protein